MPQFHPDSAAIDRIGVAAIIEHFDITRQAAHYWRRAGVPKQHRRSLALLGAEKGIELPEMRQMRDRIAPEPTFGRESTSSVSPT